jgi:hypothetical protein
LSCRKDGSDDARISSGGGVGIEVRFAQRAPLAQKVPALVERDLDLLQPLPVGLAGVPRGLALPQLVLLSDELLDRPVNL